jgi:hypothetical protein
LAVWTTKRPIPSAVAKRASRHSRTKLGRCEHKELAAVEALSDAAIDTSDIPQIVDWSKAQVGRFYRPLAKSRSRL